jgi:hypothetical protein
MKKVIMLALCIGIFPVFLFAQEEWEDDERNYADKPANWVAEDIPEEQEIVNKEKKPREKFVIKNRTVEIGLLDTSIGFANSFLSINEFFQETFVFNINELENGFKIDLDLFLSPIYFQYNHDDQWGFGISTGLDGTILIDLSGDMLSFNEAANSKSGIGGAIFAEAAVNAFFPIWKLKVKVKPAFYYPIMVIKPDISYNMIFNDDKSLFNILYDIKVYTPMPLENFPDEFNLTASPGVDFYIGAEYPLSKEHNLKDILSILDFDVGLDMYGIPLFPATMKDYMQLTGRIGMEEPADLFEGLELDNFVETSDPVYGEDKYMVFRPFKFHVWANWRPLEHSFFTVIPLLGFAINPFYLEPGSVEAAITAKLDIKKIFLVSFTTGYLDRLWKKRLDVGFNLRVFEIDLGIDLRSQDYVKSWTGAGFGAHFALKFGW